MKYIFYFLLILVIFILQTTFFSELAIVGVKPNFLLITVITAGLLDNEFYALFAGCIAGLLADCFFASYIGGNLFLYGITAFLVSLICKEFNKENLGTPMFGITIATLFYGFGNFVLNILLSGFTNIGYYLFIRIIPEIVYNCIFMIFVYIVAFIIKNKFRQNLKYKRKIF